MPRVLEAWPKIDLVDEQEANQFRAVVWRTMQVTDPVTPQVPPHAAPQVTPQVIALLATMTGEHARQELMTLLSLSDRKHFAAAYLAPALQAALVTMTIPDKPQSSKQKYRLTEAGKALRSKKRPPDNAGRLAK